jgi:hypothetical protein
MFELMEGIDVLPVSEQDIVQVHGGMNKVRISVGNYVSEPSEVYIITSQDEALLRSFVVFFVVEPGIHVIYGYAGNPYDPVFGKEVLQEAIEFVEEMGAILEDVNWENMPPEERRNWIRNETIYPDHGKYGLEVVADLEEIEPEELMEIVEEEDSLEGEKLLQPETQLPETLEEEPAGKKPEKPQDDEEGGVKREKGDEADDGDFEDLLKQAFLKPDVVEKNRVKTIRDLKDEAEEDEIPSFDWKRPETGGEAFKIKEEAMKVAEEEGSEEEIWSTVPGVEEEEPEFGVSEEDLAAAEDELSALINEVSGEVDLESSFKTSPDESEPADEDSSNQTRLTVIRYLSRF